MRLCGRYAAGVRALLLFALVLLSGCGSVGLTVHNDTDGAVQIEGLSDPLNLAAGERVRVHRRSPLGELVARDSSGSEIARITPDAPPRGGEVVWSMAGTVCYAEADFGSYYNPDPMVMPGAQVLGSLDPGQTVYVSVASVDAPPGGKLPSRARMKAIAVVEVPCQANREGEAILRSWLEVALRDIQPGS